MSQNRSNQQEDPQLLQRFIPKVTGWCEEIVKPASQSFQNLPRILPFKEFKLLLQKVQTDEEQTIVQCSQLQSQQLQQEEDIVSSQVKQQLPSEESKKLIQSQIELNLFGMIQKQRKSVKSDLIITSLSHCRSSNMSCHQPFNDYHEQNQNQDNQNSCASGKNEEIMIQPDESRFRVKPKERHVLRWSSEGKRDIRVRLVDPEDFIPSPLQAKNTFANNEVENQLQQKKHDSYCEISSFPEANTIPSYSPVNANLLDEITQNQVILPQTSIMKIVESQQKSEDTNREDILLIAESKISNERQHKVTNGLNDISQGNQMLNYANLKLRNADCNQIATYNQIYQEKDIPKISNNQQSSQDLEKQNQDQINLGTIKATQVKEIQQNQPPIQYIIKTDTGEASRDMNTWQMITFSNNKFKDSDKTQLLNNQMQETTSNENSKRRVSVLGDNNNFDETKDTTAVEISTQRTQIETEYAILDNTIGDIQALDKKKLLFNRKQEEEQDQQVFKQELYFIQKRIEVVNEKEQQVENNNFEDYSGQFQNKTECLKNMENKMLKEGQQDKDNENLIKEQRIIQKATILREQKARIKTEEMQIQNKREQTQQEDNIDDKQNIQSARDERVEQDLLNDSQKELVENTQNRRELEDSIGVQVNKQNQQEKTNDKEEIQINNNLQVVATQDGESWISPTQSSKLQNQLYQQDTMSNNRINGYQTTDIDSQLQTTSFKDTFNTQIISPNTKVPAFNYKSSMLSAEKIQSNSRKQDISHGYSVRKECSKIFLPQKGSFIEPEDLSHQLLDQISASVDSSTSHGIAISSEVFTDDKQNCIQKQLIMAKQDNNEDKCCVKENEKKVILKESNIIADPSLQQFAVSQKELIEKGKDVQQLYQQQQSLTERSFLKKHNDKDVETMMLRADRVLKKEEIQLDLKKQSQYLNEHNSINEYETPRADNSSQISSNQNLQVSLKSSKKVDQPSKDNELLTKIEGTTTKAKTQTLKQQNTHHSSLQKLTNSKNPFYQQHQTVMLQFNQHLLPQTQTNRKKQLLQNQQHNKQSFQENLIGDVNMFQTPSKKPTQQIYNSNHLDLAKEYPSGQQTSQQSNKNSSVSILRQKNSISTALPSPCQKDNLSDQITRLQQLSSQQQEVSSPRELYFNPHQKIQKHNPPSKYPPAVKDILKQQYQSQQKELEYQQLRLKKLFNQQEYQIEQAYSKCQQQQQKSPASSDLLIKKISRCNSQDQMSLQDNKVISSFHHHRRNLSDSINFIAMNRQIAPYSMKTKTNDRQQLFKKAVEYNLQVSSQNSGELQDLEMIYQKSMVNTRQKNIVSCDQGSVYCRARIKESYLQQ